MREGTSASQLHRVVNLPAYFNKTARRVKVLTDRVVDHGFNRCEGHAFPAEVFERVLDELITDASSARGRVHREIRNAALPDLAIEERRNVTENLPVFFGDERSGRVRRAVLVDVPRLARAPVVSAKDAKLLLDILVNRGAIESLDGDALEFIEVAGLEGADVHAYLRKRAQPSRRRRSVILDTGCFTSHRSESQQPPPSLHVLPTGAEWRGRRGLR